MGGIALTASGTPKVLRSVRTLDDLVGVDPVDEPAPIGAAGARQAVVIGDSTAAGWGLPWGPKPTAEDRACGRSPESYAADLAAANQWNVLNLACGSATIPNGLLGPEVLYNGEIAPPQLPRAEAATQAKVVIVSVGADDLSWSVMTQLCAASAVCDDKVSTAYFNQLLSTFTRNYYQLLSDLDRLPAHPAVLVNEYYLPFGSDVGCLQQYGMTQAKVKVLLARLGQLNTVLAQGAGLFGFGVATPRFAGHELCTADPWVQGPSDPAPLHPNAAGELAIALADQQAFPLLSPSPVHLPSPGRRRRPRSRPPWAEVRSASGSRPRATGRVQSPGGRRGGKLHAGDAVRLALAEQLAADGVARRGGGGAGGPLHDRVDQRADHLEPGVGRVDLRVPRPRDLRVAAEVGAHALPGQVGEQAAPLGDARGGVQGDRLPHAVDVTLADAVLAQDGRRQVGPFHLEAGVALGQGPGAEIVHDGGGEEQVTIVGCVLLAPFVGGQELREEEAAEAVIDDRGALGAPHHGQRGLGQRPAGRSSEKVMAQR